MIEQESPGTLKDLRKQRGQKLIAFGWEEAKRLPLVKNGKDYHSCAEIGRALGHHPDTIYHWFKDYPGVSEQPHPAKRMKDPKTGQWKVKRRHRILLIPADVFMSWLREHTKK